MTIRWYRYVDYDDVEAREGEGWRIAYTDVRYPRLEHYGVMMVWDGEGNPPEADDGRA